MNLKKMLNARVLKTITENSLIQRGDRVLTAFSGGADSVCLLSVLNELKETVGFELYAAHLNHGLRGEAAQRDEAFAKEFCEVRGIECFIFKRNVREYARACGVSEELAGREIRYSLFFDLMKEKNIQKLAVGHHADDQAETVLMHLMRGSGIDGLSGMRYMRGSIIRPLLRVRKSEILDFCKHEQLDFCTDATNFEVVYNRNKIRLELIPKMMEFNPNITDTLSDLAEISADESELISELAEREFEKTVDGNTCMISKLSAYHIALQRRIVKCMIERAKGANKDISFDCVERALSLVKKGITGKTVNLGGDISASIVYGSLVIERNKPNAEFSYTVEVDVPRELPELGAVVCIQGTKKGTFSFPEGAELMVRTRKPGDRIYPRGMNGSKKLKDFFIDEKIPREEREKAVLVLCNGEIAAVFYGSKVFEDRRFARQGGFNISLYAVAEGKK